MRRSAGIGGIGLFLIIGLLAPGTAASAMDEDIRVKIESLQRAGNRIIDGRTIASWDRLVKFYTQRRFQPAWSDAANVRSMVAAVRDSQAHGLVPVDYHLDVLQALARRPLTKAETPQARDADLDILLTDSFFQLARDLAFGRVNPARFNPEWNFTRAGDEPQWIDLLEAALAEGRVREYLEARAPSHPLYLRLKRALERFRRIAAAGGWPSLPEGPLMKTGVRDARVPLLRQRLKITGDLSVDTDGDPLVFEPALERAVLRFQERARVDRDSSLVDDDDGSVGENTLAALNVPVAYRLRQLRVNLERCRWLFHDQPATFVLVDMAGYRGYFYKDDEIVWRARVQVGKPYRETPSFRSDIKYLVFNPTWTVPPGIMHDVTLPNIRKDRTYLTKYHFQVIDRDGRRVDPSTVDWTRYTAKNLPYRIVQTPGPHNAVGRVKFIFPNEQFIYLHDTPHQSEFGMHDRAFSAGCIRIDKPFKLAKRLLDGPEKWTIGRIREIIASKRTRTVWLPEPVPVLLLYLTAQVDDQGQVFFRHDIYQRDKAVFKALDPSAPPIAEPEIHQLTG